MMAHAFEIDQTLALIAQAKAQLRARDVPFDEHIPVGAMIEIPAAALALPMFIKRLDFLSIGTNDLIQYTLAIDRVDSEVAYLYDAVHPAILFLLSTVIRQAKQANIPVSVCGEMAGDVKMTRLLLGMGLTEFSMHPAQLLAVKHEIMQSNKSALVPKVDALLTVTEPEAILEGMAKLSD
jgi:phosphotransferase system enzyme I (PtsI)